MRRRSSLLSTEGMCKIWDFTWSHLVCYFSCGSSWTQPIPWQPSHLNLCCSWSTCFFHGHPRCSWQLCSSLTNILFATKTGYVKGKGWRRAIKEERGQDGKGLRSLEHGDGELAWGSRALRACVFVFLFGHCSSKAEPRPSLGNDAASHNRLQ